MVSLKKWRICIAVLVEPFPYLWRSFKAILEHPKVTLNRMLKNLFYPMNNLKT